MKRYTVTILIVLSVLFTSSSLTYASIDLMYSGIEARESDQTLLINVVLNSDQWIENARLEYWWDNQIHTFPLPEGTVPDSPLRIGVTLSQSEIPADQMIYFRLTATDEGGDTYEWNDIYYNWKGVPLQQLESEHVIFSYKSLDDDLAHQFLLMVEEAYQSVAKILHTECPDKIRFYFLHSYEQFYTEYEYARGGVSGFYDGTTTVLILSKDNIASSKHTIIHEIVHAFQYTALYPFIAESTPPAAQWFYDIMSQYVTMKAMQGDEYIDQYINGIHSSEMQNRIIDPFWRYDEKIAILFFNYLFETYHTNDVTEVAHQFVTSSDFQSADLPTDFISYLSTQYQIDIAITDVGRSRKGLSFISPLPRDGYSYVPQSDQVVFTMHHSFHQDEKLAYDIALFDPQTNSARNITSTKYTDLKPHLAPDGKTLFFIQQYGDQYAIVNMNLENQESKRLYISKKQIFDMTLSPDGKTVIFAQLSDLTQTNLWQLQVSDRSVKQITFGSVDYSLFFRTNDRLYFISNNGEEQNIYFMDLPTQQSYLIPNTSHAASIIDINGKWCVYQAGLFSADLYLLDLTRCTSRKIMDENQFIKVWFPRLTEDGLLYFEGDELDSLTRKMIPLT